MHKDGSHFQRVLARIERVPLGREFKPTAKRLGLLQRWYVAQPNQRIAVSVLELATEVDDDAIVQALRQLCARHPSALGICEQRSPTRLELRIGVFIAGIDTDVALSTRDDAWSIAQRCMRDLTRKTRTVWSVCSRSPAISLRSHVDTKRKPMAAPQRSKSRTWVSSAKFRVAPPSG